MGNPSEDLLERFLRDRPALARRQAEADRVIAASGAGHLVHEMAARPGEFGGRPWRIDPVPLVIDGLMFDDLARDVAHRMLAIEAILADLYGPRTLVREGVVPAEALSSSSHYRIASVGTPAPRRWLTTYAADVVALADGTWRLVQDLTDAPTGIGYALLDRSAMLRVADEILGSEGFGELATLNGFPAELRHALTTNTSVTSPRIVLYTGGVDHAGYVEHSSLARIMGFTLVERPDLVVRQRRLWLRTLGGLDPIDVVYRRVEDHDVDPVEIAGPGGAGVPGLLMAVADGGVVLANAHGSGLLEDRSLVSMWATAARHLVGESLTLAPLEPTAELAEVPVFRRGELGSAAVVVRVHAVAGPDGVSVMPGGNGRVLAAGDVPHRPTAHLAKDVWVVGSHAARPVIVAPALPQVDLALSVPTRAADALYWTGRSAERAEAIARTVRVIAARRRQDPTLAAFDGGRWARRMSATLRVVRDDSTPAAADVGAVAELNAELRASTRAVVHRLRGFVAEAATVGEFLSANTTRILSTLVQHVESFDDGAWSIDALDDVLAALAAFSGMWNESTVRGPVWRFGDIGVRLERALVVLSLVSACVEPSKPTSEWFDVDVVDVAALEVLLEANTSLVAYRRQYRSDVQLAPTIELLLRDRDNPRAYAACMDRLAEHVADVEWNEGMALVDLLTETISAADAAELAGSDPVVNRITVARDAVVNFAAAIDERWFATPVKPMLL